jgi:hypothetical protein
MLVMKQRRIMNPRVQTPAEIDEETDDQSKAPDEFAKREADLIDEQRYAGVDDPSQRARDLRIAEDELGIDDVTPGENADKAAKSYGEKNAGEKGE